MVTIVSLDKEFASSSVYGAKATVKGARHGGHAMMMVLEELERTGWEIHSTRYESTLNEDGTHTVEITTL